MKVALLVPSFSPDAEGDVTTPLVRTVVESLCGQVTLHVFPLRFPATARVTTHHSATVHAIGGEAMRFRHVLRATISALRVEQRRGRFDVLHALWLHEPGTIAVAAGALLHVPVIASIGGAEVARLPDINYGAALTRRGRLVARFVMRRAKRTTGGSRYVLDLARALGGRSSGLLQRLVPLPVDAERFRPPAQKSFDPTRPRLFHAASLTPVKDQATLLRAFAIIQNRIPAATLQVAGGDPFGHRHELELLRDALGLRPHVTFLGDVPHADLVNWYHSSDVFLLSSRHESQCMVVLEAAACGVPTVGTAVGVVPDLAPVAAVAAPLADPRALAAAALELLEDPNRLADMGTAARNRVCTDFAIGPAISRILGLYEEVVAEARR